MRGVIAAALGATLLVATTIPAGAALPASPVITGAARQYHATADLEWIAWTQAYPRRHTYDVYAQLLDGTGRVQVDTRKPLISFAGDFDPVDARLLFQEGSNLRYWDRDSSSFGPPPGGINTKYWEWSPRVSSNFILFGRNKFDHPSSPWKVVLYDRVLQTFKTLDAVTYRCGCIWPEAVTDQFAAWTTCRQSCQVWIYDIANGTTSRVPNPGLQQYSAGLTPDGDVYFARGGSACGADIGIWRWAIGQPADAVLVHELGPGIENYARISVTVDGGGHEDVYFDRFQCPDGRPDVYVVQDADTVMLASHAAPTDEGGIQRMKPGGAEAQPMPGGRGLT